jgi:tRNA (mo5U34)-methyltransferase
LTAESIATAVANTKWYHSIHLPNGIVTPGEYDHTPMLEKLPLPASLAGKRCLDVGTHDGFFAFEMEKRGSTDVVAIDIDDPGRLDWHQPAPVLGPELHAFINNRRAAFDIAHQALDSQVHRQDISVYDLTPDNVGEFDFAFIGTLLHHLRDPMGALIAIRRVVRGQLLVSAVVSPTISFSLLHRKTPVSELLRINGGPFWEIPNAAGVRRQVEMAGWRVVSATRPHLQPHGAGAEKPKLNLRPGNWRQLPRDVVFKFGIPHIGLLLEPNLQAPTYG